MTSIVYNFLTFYWLNDQWSVMFQISFMINHRKQCFCSPSWHFINLAINRINPLPPKNLLFDSFKKSTLQPYLHCNEGRQWLHGLIWILVRSHSLISVTLWSCCLLFTVVFHPGWCACHFPGRLWCHRGSREKMIVLFTPQRRARSSNWF